MAVREAIPRKAEAEEGVSSFAKSLFLGEIHEELVFPWPTADAEEQERIRDLNARIRDYCAEHYDPRQAEEERWIPDRVLRDLGEIGALGLYVETEYGGQGLSQTGYARVFETVGQIDATLAIVLGVHQSIGFKGISLFGTDEQKERFLPDLATGRKLAAFALTEPEAGSDAYHLRSRAVEQPDGSWVLNGEKRYIGNGSRADVITTFARAEVDGEDKHIALILEKGMKGLEVGERYDTMGLQANDLRRLYFKDVRVPPENVLGEPGQGFRVAMQVLNNGRIGLGTGSVGGAKKLLDLSIEHVKERRQFGQPLADFELVQDKIGWMVSYLFGLESMTYLTCGLVDAGVPDYSLESAICKVSGTEFLWYAANRALQLAGRRGLHARPALREGAPRHPHLSDLRGRERRDAGLHRTRRVQAGRREARGPLRDRAERPDRLDRRPDRLRLGPDPARGPPGQDHAGARGPLRARRCGLRAGEATGGRHREAPAGAPQGHHRPAVPAEAPRRQHRRHLRAVRGALARQPHLRGPGRRALGPGALHRRHLLPASRGPGRRAGSTRSSRTTTSG